MRILLYFVLCLFLLGCGAGEKAKLVAASKCGDTVRVDDGNTIIGEYNAYYGRKNLECANKIPRSKPSRLGSTFASRKRGIFPYS